MHTQLDLNIIIPFCLVVLVAVGALVKLSFAEKSKGSNGAYGLRDILDSVSRRYVALAEYSMKKFYSKNSDAPVDENGRAVPFGARVSFDNGHVRRHGILALNFNDDDTIDDTCPFVFIDVDARERFHPGLVKNIRIDGEGRFV